MHDIETKLVQPCLYPLRSCPTEPEVPPGRLPEVLGRVQGRRWEQLKTKADKILCVKRCFEVYPFESYFGT